MVFLILAAIIVMFFMFPALTLRIIGVGICILLVAGILWVSWYLFIFALILGCIALVFYFLKKLFMIFFKGDDNDTKSKYYKKDDFIEVDVVDKDKN